MRRAATVIGIVIGVGLLWLAFTGTFAPPGRSEAQPARQAQTPKWEYAMIAHVTNKGVSWETPDRTIVAKSFGELNRKLGAAENATQSVLFTRLGRDGWELVSHTMRTTGGPAAGTHTVWTFKRPAR